MAPSREEIAFRQRVGHSLEVLAAAAQLPALEAARQRADLEFTKAQTEEGRKDAGERLNTIDRGIRRAEKTLGIPEVK